MEVSVLTGSPGPDLYSAWGHTAIRVFDTGQTPPVDWTYNYGTFEFGEGFYLRFMRGELNYRLAKSPFSSFSIASPQRQTTSSATYPLPLALPLPLGWTGFCWKLSKPS